jgi:hypothetical protein
VREPRRLPAVLSVEEVTLLLQAAPGPKYKAALAGSTPGGGQNLVNKLNPQDFTICAGAPPCEQEGSAMPGI